MLHVPQGDDPNGQSRGRMGLTIRLFFKHVAGFVGVAAPIAGVMAGLQFIASLIQWPALIAQLASLSRLRPSDVSVGAIAFVTCAAVIVLVLGVFWPWMDGALTYLATEHLWGRQAGARDAWRAARPQWGSLWVVNAVRVATMGATWLMALGPVAIVALGTASAGRSTGAGLAVVMLALCCLPVFLIGAGAGAVIGAVWSLAFPAAVAEATEGFSALNRSAQLTEGFRMRMLGRSLALAVFWLALNAPFVALQVLAVLGAVGARGNGPASTGMFVVYALCALALAVLFVAGRSLNAIYYATCYLEARNRPSVTPKAPAYPVYSAPGIRVASPAGEVNTPAEPGSSGAVLPAPPVGVAGPAAGPARVPPLETDATPAMRVGHYFNRLLVEGDRSDTLNELGMAYMDVGDLGAALDALQRARTLAPDDPDVMYNQMRAHLARGDISSARRAMADYLRAETNIADRDATLSDLRFRALL